MIESFAWIALILSAALLPVCFFMLHRNDAVYRVKLAFIGRSDWARVYFLLPSYEQMLYSPKYWLLWTPAHWEAWLARQDVSTQS